VSNNSFATSSLLPRLEEAISATVERCLSETTRNLIQMTIKDSINSILAVAVEEHKKSMPGRATRRSHEESSDCEQLGLDDNPRNSSSGKRKDITSRSPSTNNFHVSQYTC
jgi:hypothetical protein